MNKLIIFACVVGCAFTAMAAIEPQVDANGNMTFTVSEGAAETYAGVIEGEGITVVKRGKGALTLTGVNTFTGELRIEEGTLTTSADAHPGKPKLVVLNGATFESAGGGAAWGTLSFESISIEGAGVNGNGAFVRKSGTSIRQKKQPPMMLTGDATINFVIAHNPGAVSLNGYTLTKIGKGNWDAYETGAVSANLDRDGSYGKIVIKEGALQLQYQAITLGCDKNVLTFMAGTAFNMYPVSWGPKCPWTVKVEGDATFNSKSEETANRALVSLSGPVEITGGLLTLAHSKPNATWNFEGPVTAADGGGIKAKSGVTRFNGDVDLGDGTYEVVKSDSPADARVEFSSNFNATATAAKSFLPRKGLTRFAGAKSVSVGAPLGDLNDKWSLDGGTTGRVEVADVELFSHPHNTYLSGTLEIPQTLYITNSVWNGAGNVVVGNNFSYGRLEMIDSIVSNSVRVGGNMNDGYARSRGAIYQNGGALCIPSSTTTLLGGAFGSSFGYYENIGGALDCPGELFIGGKGYGAAYFSGASAAVGKVGLAWYHDAAKDSSGAGVYYQTGGGTNSLYQLVFCNSTVTNGYALAVLEGSGTRLTVRDGGCINLAGCPSLTIFAVNDGAEFRVTNFKRKAAAVPDAFWHISVDGGLLEPGWFGEGGWGKVDDGTLPDAVIVHEGGMTLKTVWSEGVVGEFYWRIPLTAPTGKIVSQISLPEDENFLTSHQGLYLGPPLVRIHGSGTGAAAVALFDKTTRRVTGIKVVAAGTGYDENTTVEISGADGVRGSFQCPVTLADAPTTGAGFTKDGPGNYVFNVPNTYHGPTRVKAGKLLVRHAQGIPEGSSLSVSAGATADLNNFTLSVPCLSGAGTVKVGGSLTVAERLELPTKKGECLTVDGPLTLADGAEIVFGGDVADLDGQTVNRLFSAASLTCAGSVRFSELPAFWRMNVGNKGITVRRIRGTAVVFR